MKNVGKRIQIIYTGARVNSSNKLVQSYFYIGENQTYLFNKKLRDASIGTILEVEETEDGVKGPYEFKGHCDKDKYQKELAEWETKHYTSTKEIALQRDMKKINKTRYDYAIDDLKSIKSSLSYQQKKIFIMRVMMDLGV